VGISRQRNSGCKAEQNKYRGTSPLLFPPPFPSLALIHTTLFGWALIRLQASGLAEYIKIKNIGRAASALHTHGHASLVSRYTTLVPPLKLSIRPDSYGGFSSGT